MPKALGVLAIPPISTTGTPDAHTTPPAPVPDTPGPGDNPHTPGNHPRGLPLDLPNALPTASLSPASSLATTPRYPAPHL